MSKRTPQPDKKALEDAADAIVYEISMLLNTRYVHADAQAKLQAATTLRDRTYWITAQNAAVESFLLHYRNLQQFLNNLKFVTDAKAIDYVSTWKPDPRLNTPDEDKRLNQRLAHLTYDRATHKRGWNLEELERRLCPVLTTFLDQLDSRYSPLFADCRINLKGHGY